MFGSLLISPLLLYFYGHIILSIHDFPDFHFFHKYILSGTINIYFGVIISTKPDRNVQTVQDAKKLSPALPADHHTFLSAPCFPVSVIQLSVFENIQNSVTIDRFLSQGMQH